MATRKYRVMVPVWAFYEYEVEVEGQGGWTDDEWREEAIDTQIDHAPYTDAQRGLSVPRTDARLSLSMEPLNYDDAARIEVERIGGRDASE